MFDDVSNISALIDWDKLLFLTVSSVKQVDYSIRALTPAVRSVNYSIRIFTNKVKRLDYCIRVLANDSLYFHHSVRGIVSDIITGIYNIRKLENNTELLHYNLRILANKNVSLDYTLIERVCVDALINYSTRELIAHEECFVYDAARPYGILASSRQAADQIDASTSFISGGGIVGTGSAATAAGSITGTVEAY